MPALPFFRVPSRVERAAKFQDDFIPGSVIDGEFQMLPQLQFGGQFRSQKSYRAAGVLHALRRGHSLHFEHVKGGGSRWSLSNGHAIPARVARDVIADPRVVDCGGALFDDIPGQVFRFAGGSQ
jgi:hypothetical protein